MNIRSTSFACIAALAACILSTARAADSSLIAPGAMLQKVSSDFKFTEGPAVDAGGNVLFTDQPNDRIMQWSPDGKFSTFLQPAGRANGMYFDRKGQLIVCADEKNELWSISPDRKVTVLLKDYQGHLFNGPNDTWVRPDNALYFTDPLYKRPYWKRDPATQQGGEHVYFFGADRKTLLRVTDDLKQPNGIIGTADGMMLYVSDIGAGKTYAYDIQLDGSLRNKRLFCSLGSDGMTIDDRGNVYLTGKGVTVFDPAGTKIENFAIDEPWTANVCFGGADRQTLFITAGKSVYTLRMQTKGVTK